jgi:hypothetical protein
MKPIRWVVPLGLICILGCKPSSVSTESVAQSGDNAQVASDPTSQGLAESNKAWIPDPAISSQLAAEEEFAGFLIAPPKDFEAIRPPSPPPGTRTIAWKGAERSDGTAPSVQWTAIEIPADGPEMTLEIGLGKFLGSIRSRRQNWTESEPEYGSLGGVAFIKKSWSGREPFAQVDMLGTHYVAIVGNRVISLSTQDLAEYAADVKVCEESLKTFKAMP